LKKIFFITVFVSVLIIFSFFLLKKSSPFFEYKLEGKIYKLLTAKNSSEWAKGLMNYKSKKELKGADGMIFIFPDKEVKTFWNKNTYLDLDVYWLNDDKVVGKDYLPSIIKTKQIFTIESKVKVNKVVEIIR